MQGPQSNQSEMPDFNTRVSRDVSDGAAGPVNVSLSDSVTQGELESQLEGHLESQVDVRLDDPPEGRTEWSRIEGGGLRGIHDSLEGSFLETWGELQSPRNPKWKLGSNGKWGKV